MKFNITKLKALNIINLVLVAAVVLLVLLQLVVGIVNLTLFQFVIVCLFAAIAVSLLCKSLLFKSDNSLWFGLLLLSFAGLQLFFKFYPVCLAYKWFWHVLASGGCSLVVGWVFKERFAFALAMVFAFVSVPIFMYAALNLHTALFIVLLVFSFVLGYVLQRFLPHRKVNQLDE